MNSPQYIPAEISPGELEEPSKCPYYPERQTRNRTLMLKETSKEYLDFLMENNYRRFGPLYYRSECPSCQECEGIRLKVADFRPSKSQRRLLKKNQHLSFVLAKPSMTVEKWEMYCHYQDFKHAEPQQAPESQESKQEQFDQNRTNFYWQMNHGAAWHSEIYLENKLVAFGTLDQSQRGISSVYFIFDPQHSHLSLGNFSILKEIEVAKRIGLEFYYLGYYLKNHPKMNYKARFQPAQIKSGILDDWQNMDGLEQSR